DQVLAAIKSVLGTPHALSADDVVAALATSTGLDLTQYSASWLHGTGQPAWPRYAITFTAAPDTSTLVLHQVNTAPGGCAFHVDLDGATADDKVLVAVDTFAHAGDQTLQVPTPAFTVTGVAIDPMHECLAFLDSASPIVAPPRMWISAHGVADGRF